MTDNWLALIKFCEKNPYMTIERLEIYGGNPVLLVVIKQISNTATANIRIKYDSREKSFTSQLV